MQRGRLSTCLIMALAVCVGAGGVVFAEKKTVMESVKSDIEDGLGLTSEQRQKIRAYREEYKTKQQALRRQINRKNELLRQELDGDDPVRSKVDAVSAEIKSLQGQLIDNRVEVVFRLRGVYTPEQIRLIRERLEKQRQEDVPKRTGRKTRKLQTKKVQAKPSPATARQK